MAKSSSSGHLRSTALTLGFRRVRRHRVLPGGLLQWLLGLLPWKFLCSQLPQQLREPTILFAFSSSLTLLLTLLLARLPLPPFFRLQISVFIFIAIYIVTSCISGWKFKSYDEMDFSEMDAIREERAWNEANPKPKMSWYRSLIEKVTDE